MSYVSIYANQAEINGINPNPGDIVLRSNDNTLLLWNGSQWKEFKPDAGVPFPNAYSVAFDGINQHMAVTGITLPSAKTVSFWIRWQGDTSVPAVLFGDNTGNYYPYMENNREIRLSNRLLLTTWDLGANNGVTDAWAHIAIAGDGTTAKLYKNGVYIGSAADRAPGAMDKIGGASLSGFRYLNGQMDDFAIFSSALSDGGVSTGQTAQGDIATLYNNGSPGDLSSLTPLHWWRMGDNDSGAGTTITDQGSGGNDGTLVNGPTFSTDTPN